MLEIGVCFSELHVNFTLCERCHGALMLELDVIHARKHFR